MKCTLDSKGRVLIPKKIREQAGLKPGTPVSIRWRDGRIEIEIATLSVRLVQKGHLLVAVPKKEIDELESGTVEETREALRSPRTQVWQRHARATPPKEAI
jgi:AbrB family looped-hinge helix DNA binding protein